MTNNLSLSANAVVIAGNGEDMKILVVKRRYPPFSEHWALPGGFVKESESPLDACLRELAKETGVKADASRAIELTLRSNTDRDPRGEIEAQAFLFLYQSHEGVGEAVANDSIREVGWMSLKNLPELAFDHGAILCEALGKFWPIMPSYDDRTKGWFLPAVFSSKNISNEKELVFFGGSFNPWHDGHQACLDLCPNKNIIVIPDFSPWKEDSTASGCRWKSYKALAVSMADEPYAVFPGFWGRETPNPTVDWLPHTNVSKRELLMGRDSYANILKWKKARDLLSSVQTLFVVPRDMAEEEQADLQNEIKNLNKDLNIEVLGEHQFKHLSSSEIRAKNQVC